MKQVRYTHLGNMEYGTAWDLQESLLKKALEIKAARHSDPESDLAKEEIPHHLFVVNHPHVYTLGKSGDMAHLLLSEERLREIDAVFYKTNRGGDITYHGPGQLVAYPVLDLEDFYTDLGRYMRELEEVVIRTVAHYGIEAGRLQGATGVWIEPENPARARKICAMGVKCSRWVTIHGLALNMNADLRYFGYIVPCGITDKGVTSIAQEIGREVDEREVTEVFLKNFKEVFDVSIVPAEIPTNAI